MRSSRSLPGRRRTGCRASGTPRRRSCRVSRRAPRSPARADRAGRLPARDPTAAPPLACSVVVSVTAESPPARKRPCSSSANGTPRSTSCVGTDGSDGLTPTSSATRAAAVRTSVRAGDTGSSPAIASRGRPAAEVVEDDDGDRTRARTRDCFDEACGARAAERARVGRHEHQRVLGDRVGPELLRCESPRELDEHRGTGRVLAGRLFGARVVAMSNEHDGLLGATRDHGDDVAELDVSEIRELLRPDVLLCPEAERADRLLIPPRRSFGALRARHARRVLDGDASRRTRLPTRRRTADRASIAEARPLSRSRTETRETRE